MRPGAMAFGWPAGCARAVLRLTLSTLIALRCHANIAAQRQIASIRNCCCAPCLDGCAARSVTAAWSRSQRSKRRMPNGRTVSETASSPSRPASETKSRRRRFRQKLRKAEQQLKELRTAEGSLLPGNTRAELFRHLARLHIVREQIRAIEKARLQRLEADRNSNKSPHAMVRLMARVVGIGVETADMLVTEVFSRQFC